VIRLGGYIGKILRVDLTRSTIVEEELPGEDALRKYVGCFGLGLKLFYSEFCPGFSPLDPENPLIFMTGPLTGVPQVPSSSNTTITTLNADTGFTVGRSHSHGFWGPKLKFAGYDGLIVTGAAESPVYLWVHNGETEIRDASGIWGKDTHESEDAVKEEVANPGASVAAIGPAGENLCAGALIENDKNHSFSHSGVGAVMGSKKLKAIAVYGSRRVEVADEEKLKDVTKRWRENVFKSDVGTGLGKAGIPRSEYSYIKGMSIMSAKNLLDVSPPEFGVGMSSYRYTPKACHACPIACSYNVEVTSGPYKGCVATMAGGGENMEGAASISGVYESGAVFYLTDLFDRLGFDSATLGCTISMATEAYEKGLITKEETGGVELKWGNPKLVEKLARMAARRDGWLGELLALGPKRAAELIGGDAPSFAIHIKGAGLNLHDWRATWGILLGQAVGGGSGWPSQGADAFGHEVALGYTEFEDPLDPTLKPVAVQRTTTKKAWDDCHGTCWFAAYGVPEVIELSALSVGAVTGWDFTREEAMLVGERVANLERVFNVRLGLTPEDDYNICQRLLDPPPSGRAKGKSIAPYLRGMVMEYYRLMGWDEKTGKPWVSTLKRLGLEDCIADIWR